MRPEMSNTVEYLFALRENVTEPATHITIGEFAEVAPQILPSLRVGVDGQTDGQTNELLLLLY